MSAQWLRLARLLNFALPVFPQLGFLIPAHKVQRSLSAPVQAIHRGRRWFLGDPSARRKRWPASLFRAGSLDKSAGTECGYCLVSVLPQWGKPIYFMYICCENAFLARSVANWRLTMYQKTATAFNLRSKGLMLRFLFSQQLNNIKYCSLSVMP